MKNTANKEALSLTVGGETFRGFHPTITQSQIEKQFMPLIEFEYNDFEDFIKRERAYTCGIWMYYNDLDKDDVEILSNGDYLVIENDRFIIRIWLSDASVWIIIPKNNTNLSIYKYWD